MCETFCLLAIAILFFGTFLIATLSPSRYDEYTKTSHKIPLSMIAVGFLTALCCVFGSHSGSEKSAAQKVSRISRDWLLPDAYKQKNTLILREKYHYFRMELIIAKKLVALFAVLGLFEALAQDLRSLTKRGRGSTRPPSHTWESLVVPTCTKVR